MTLTRLIKLPDVRERFAQEFTKPRLSAKKAPLVAPPQSKRYMLIGTAFDYLLRFSIERLNPQAIRGRWVAESGLAHLGQQAGADVEYDLDAKEVFVSGDGEALKRAAAVLDRGRAAYKQYMASGQITDDLLKAVIGLAQLDFIYRSGIVDEHLGVAFQEDVLDLRNLISFVRPSEFSGQQICLLNPTFGVGSRLVGGADADMFLDGMLVEIKTTKNLQLKREHFNQLLGYLALHELWGFDGVEHKPRISRLGIYFARHAYLHVFDVEDAININTFPQFLDWFKHRVEQRRERASVPPRNSTVPTHTTPVKRLGGFIRQTFRILFR